MKAYIVEDDESMRMILKRFLRRNFPSITEYGESESAEKALKEIHLFCPDLLFVDISLPGIDGIELIRRIHEKMNPICILVVTGHEIDLYKEAAFKAGADNIVSKSDDKELLKVIGDLVEKHRTEGCD